MSTPKKDLRKGNSGRKPYKKRELRTKRNVLKTNAAEQKQLQANAKKAGYSSIVVWLRELGLAHNSGK